MGSYLGEECKVYEAPPHQQAGYAAVQWVLSSCQVTVRRSFAPLFSVINRHRSSSMAHSADVCRSPGLPQFIMKWLLWVLASSPHSYNAGLVPIALLPALLCPPPTSKFFEITPLPWVLLSLLDVCHFQVPLFYFSIVLVRRNQTCLICNLTSNTYLLSGWVQFWGPMSEVLALLHAFLEIVGPGHLQKVR